MAKAWEVPGLRGSASFREAGGRIILTRWRELDSHRAGTLAGEDIEELHAMRVSSRRLRAAMDAFAEAFPRTAFRRHLQEVKRIADTLGGARDLDVAIEGLRARLEGGEEVERADEVERVGLIGLIARYEAARARETPRIEELFRRLEEERFPARFESFVARHTGVRADRLGRRPPASLAAPRP